VRVLCCHTDLYDATRTALEKYAPQAEYVDVSGDIRAYWRAIAERWTGESDLLIVEQDIEIHDQVIPRLEACPEDWCTFPYRLWRPDAWCYNALGCTRFSAALQKAVSPEEITQARARWLVPNASSPNAIGYSGEEMPPGEECGCGGQGSEPCWRHLDFKIATTLAGNGPWEVDRIPYQVHVHEPPVCHMPVDKPVNENAVRVTEYPFQLPDRAIEFPFEEPSRTFHSDSLADRPPWWPYRPPGVTVADGDKPERVVTTAEARDPDLSETAAQFLFGTDKIGKHGYFRPYQQLAFRLPLDSRVCEVGIWQGESLKLWQAFFPAGLIAGVDRDPDAIWPEGTARVVAAQDDETLPGKLTAVSPDGFDLIIDDASHDGKLTRRTWELLWPLVRPDGFYVIEDWSEGTMAALAWKPGAVKGMLEMAQSFVPLLRLQGCDPDSIEYRYGLIIMHKRARLNAAPEAISAD
jgi:hypothetical protein